MNTVHTAAVLLALVSVASFSVSAQGPGAPPAASAQTLLDASGVKGGLVVHVGCDDAHVTAGLCASARYTIQGLEPDAGRVEAARNHLHAQGLYGRISVRRWDGKRLPYTDGLVNLVVVSDQRLCPAAAELRRVLAPGGTALVKGALPAGLPKTTLVRDSGLAGWTRYVNPVPTEIDEWTHYLHDAGNNAVADDDRVGPPQRIRWKNGPMWCRSHEFASSVHTLISAKGRLFGIIDEGITGQPRGVPALWTLIARDAFNGILLWRLPCEQVNPHALAAVNDKVYVTLRRRGPLSILDAATGNVLHTCKETGGVEELALCDGKVLLHTFLSDQNGKTVPHIAAADPANGHLLWKRAVKGIQKNTLVAADGRACYCNGSALTCVSLANGEKLWQAPVKIKGRGYAVLYGGAVFVTGGRLRAFALETGKPLWDGPDASPHARNPPGLFGANGLVWRAWEHVDPRSFVWQHRPEVRQGLDPLTGEVRKTVTAERLVTAGHHIRCYPAKATKRYLLLNKRGVEFLDLEGNNHMRANWTRAACGFGMLPANGLLYAPPSQCFCYQGVLLAGLNALEPAQEPPPVQAEKRPRLTRGPAYGGDVAPAATDAGRWWPTYRHDPMRSGSIDTALPKDLVPLWERRVADAASQPDDTEQPDRAESANRTILLAGDARIHGTGARRDDTAVVAWRGQDTTISWKAELAEGGTLPVWIRQSNQGPGGSVYELGIGKQTLTGSIRHTATWLDYVWVRVGEVTLPAAGTYAVTVKPLKQVDGRLGNVAAVAIGGQTPPEGQAAVSRLREYPRVRLTPPVATEAGVFVVAADRHTVHALDPATGNPRWHFVADGRIDSPPTIHRGLCLFGCRDGNVYCLHADDGALRWRFRAAPRERQICAFDQVESAWPVHGSVLVHAGNVYVTAGRSSYLDGGIYVYALDPATGALLHEARLHNDPPDVATDGGRPFDMDGAKSDILVAGGNDIYLYQKRFTPDLTPVTMPRITKLGDRSGEAHLMTTTGFLDTSWFNRTYWTYGERWPGYYFTYRGPKAGQILVFDKASTYALKVYTQRRGHSPEFVPGTGYILLADRNTTKPVLDIMDIGAEKGRGFSRTELPIWTRRVPIRAQGMVLARDRLYLAGPPDPAAPADAYAAMIGKKGAVFRVVSTADGATLSEFTIAQAPVFDGLIAANGRLYMSTLDGTLICFGEKR